MTDKNMFHANELTPDELESVAGGVNVDFIDVHCEICNALVASYLKNDEGGKRIAMQYLNEHMEIEHGR